jgi:uncharacterized membrane protein YkoI
MPVSRRLLAATLLLGLLAVPALATDVPFHGCLSKTEQRAALAAHRAIPLAQAIKSSREHGYPAEVIRARLCHRGDGLVYMLTLFARSGKVTVATVDAATGSIIGGR